MKQALNAWILFEKGKTKMIRSNSKKAIENIRAYILDNTTAENYEIKQPETFKEGNWL